MARRYSTRMNGERFLANSNASQMEVHDLDNEKSQCQIDAIIRADHERPYTSLATASAAGYDNCAYCIGGSTR